MQFDLENLGYSSAFNFGGPQNSGTDISIQYVQYGSTVRVEFYKHGVFVESYSLLFTIDQPIIELTAPSIVDELKSPGTFKLTSSELGQENGVLQMGVEYRGSTSQEFRKKSFTMSLVGTPYPGDE